MLPLLAIISNSCSKDDPDHYLKVDPWPRLLLAATNNGIATISVDTNYPNISVECSENDWCTIEYNPQSPKIIKVSALDNPSSRRRQFVLYVNARDFGHGRMVDIIQEKGVEPLTFQEKKDELTGTHTAYVYTYEGAFLCETTLRFDSGNNSISCSFSLAESVPYVTQAQRKYMYFLEDKNIVNTTYGFDFWYRNYSAKSLDGKFIKPSDFELDIYDPSKSRHQNLRVYSSRQ